MHKIESIPPVRALAPACLALLFAVARLWHPWVKGVGASAPVWLLLLAIAATLALLGIVLWLALGMRYRLDEETLRVSRLIGFGGHRVHRLADLNSVGVAGTGWFNMTVTTAAFKDGGEVRIPRYHTHAGDLFAALFSQLGRNFASEREESELSSAPPQPLAG